MSADKTAKLKRFSSFELGDHRAECEDGSVQFENDILIEPRRLIKPLYGLKRSGFCWYKTLDETLIAQGWTSSSTVRALYTKGEVSMLVYVDDLLMVGPEHLVQKAMKELQSALETSNVNYLSRTTPLHFLGIFISQAPNGDWHISQSSYIARAIKKYEDQTGAILERLVIPAYQDEGPPPPNVKVIPDPSKAENFGRTWIGVLMYAARGTRPDILHAVARLARCVTR